MSAVSRSDPQLTSWAAHGHAVRAQLLETMTIRRVVPNLVCRRMQETQEFYVELLGFKVAMDMGWIVTLASPESATAQSA